MLETATLRCQKQRFSLPEKTHYLNCAYMAPLSKKVEEAGIKGVKRKVNPTLLTPENFFTETNEARALFGRLVNAPAERIAIIPAASYGIATVVKNIKLEPGQNIILTAEQFPSNVYAWQSYEEQGVTVKMIAAPDNYARGKSWNEAILDAIDEDTGVVALGHVHWTDGTLFDLEAIGQKARDVGAALIVDATQSVGALPFDVAKIQPDALLVAGYKTLMGPYGLGCAYYGPRFDNGAPLEESWITRKGSENFSGLVDYQREYADGAVRFDMGERSNFTLMPMLVAALEDVLERQPERIQAYCGYLTEPLVKELKPLGYRCDGEPYRAKHLFGLRLPSQLSLDTLTNMLADRNVFVSVRGSSLRVSTNVYNDKADIEALLEVLKEAATQL